jgi:subtilisin family serine protease
MDGHTTIITRAAEIAASKGILVVAAVGNDGDNSWHFLSAPSDANGDSVVAAGAVDASGVPASFSSYGPSADGRIKPDLAARGVSVPHPNTSGSIGGYADYRTQNGTSFSTPLIAGVATCLLGARPQATPREVIRAMRASASRKASPDVRVGYGVPNAATALALLAGGFAPTPRLAVSVAGPNPVLFARGPARFTVGVPLALCGARASVDVRDVMGRRIRRLWSGVVSCAPFPLTWDGLDDEGRATPAGLYLVDARVGSEHATLRLVGLR